MTPVYKFSTARSIVGPNTYYSSMLAENSVFDPSSPYDLLQTYMLPSNQSSVEFSNLSSYSNSYTSLQIRYYARVTENIGGNIGTFYLNVNGDTASNYARHIFRWDGSTVYGNGISGVSTPDIGGATGSGADNDVFAVGIMEIIDPFRSDKNLVVKTLGGSVNPQEVGMYSLMWNNTDSLNTLAFETYGTHNFVTNTRFSLYGRGG